MGISNARLEDDMKLIGALATLNEIAVQSV